MDMVFLCSPYRGDTETNIKNVKRYCRYVMNQFLVPIAPHLYFTQFLNDEKSADRKMGIDMGLAILPYCKEIWVIADEVTEGMMKEIKVAQRLGLKFIFRNSDMEEIDYDALSINKRVGPGLKEVIEDVNSNGGGIKCCACSGKCKRRN